MSEQSNICEICGGAVSLGKSRLKTSRGIPVTSVIPPELRTARACLGHSKDAPKHDGKLDTYQNGYNECRVTRIDDVAFLVMEESGNHLTYVPGILIDGVGDMVGLTAKQAISLLSWLEQNRAELTALAEQERE